MFRIGSRGTLERELARVLDELAEKLHQTPPSLPSKASRLALLLTFLHVLRLRPAELLPPILMMIRFLECAQRRATHI